MAENEERRRIAHLLRRGGFGATPDEVERCLAQGYAATVDELVEYERVPDTLDAVLGPMEGNLLDLSVLEDAQTWWLYRMVHTRRPLEERLTLFWHGHFATANSKVNNPLAMHNQNALLRRHALGNFRTLVLEVSRDPAMLIWLDGNTNRKAAPNENYGRELLELFTLGIGNYTEDDVRETARAFTGWNLRPAKRVPVFNFDRNQHDDGEKTILGRTGTWGGEEAIDIILDHPAHAPFLVRKLFACFAYDDPEPEVIEPFVRLYRDGGFELKPVVRAILLSEAFQSRRARREHVRSPVELVVGTIRTLGIPVRERTLVPMLAAMGQALYNPPNVGGWKGGLAWINPSTLVERFNFAARLTAFTGQPPYEGGQLDPEEFGRYYHLTDWAGAVDLVLSLFHDEPDPAVRAILLDYVAGADMKPRTVDMKLRGLLHLALAASESHLA